VLGPLSVVDALVAGSFIVCVCVCVLSVSDLCAFLHCAQERAFFVVMSSWEDPVGIIVSARSSLEGNELKNTKTNVD
jgi:hypothetical protein